MNESDRRKKSAQNSATYLALIGLAVACILLLLMATAVLPAAVWGITVVSLIFSGMLSFHYFTWGRSMERADRRKSEKDKSTD